MNTPDWEGLRAFRHQVYTLLGCRRAALFELLDAVLRAPTLETPAHLSLAPSCQRGWGSLYDALIAGTLDLPRLEALVGSYPLATETAWYAVDASVWPRGDAETSPARGYYPHPYRHSHGQPIVAGWNYSWLVQLPSRCSSWTAPLRVRQLTPGENPNAVAAEPIHSWLGQAPPTAQDAPLPIFSFDAGFGPVQVSLALADQPVCLVVRLRAGRCCYADPMAQPTTGRPRRHGAKVVCAEPSRQPGPSRPTSGRPTIPRMGGCRCTPGVASIPFPNGLPSGTHAAPGRWCAGPSFAWRCSALAAPHPDARAPVVLVVGTPPARVGRHLAGVHCPVLD